jgi:flagellar biosynthesis protein FlhG
VCIGGGRAGAGQSTLAANFAVYFAQLGKSVVLVDADGAGGALHTHFGVPAATSEPPATGDSVEALESALVVTRIPGLRLLPAPVDGLSASLGNRARRGRSWLSRVRTLPTDYLVVDAGPGHGTPTVDLMLRADVSILAFSPDPAALESSLRFLRSAFRRRLRTALLGDKFRRVTVERAYAELGQLASPLALVRTLMKMDPTLARAAWEIAQALRFHVVANQTRLRADLDLGQATVTLVSEHHGLELNDLGYVEYDDAVWASARKRQPLLVEAPTSRAARNVERVARRVLALGSASEPEGTAVAGVPPEEPSYYTFFGIVRSASDEEIRRAYKRKKDIYGDTSVAAAALLDEATLRKARTRLAVAYDTLLDPVRRRAYDLSTFSSEPEPTQQPEPTRSRPDAELLMLRAELASEIGPETQFTGRLLRKAREALGLELSDISQTTKIARSHLHAIEEEDFGALPAVVYVRGFLGEIAKQLKLDPALVQRTYLKRLRETREALGARSHRDPDG